MTNPASSTARCQLGTETLRSVREPLAAVCAKGFDSVGVCRICRCRGRIRGTNRGFTAMITCLACKGRGFYDKQPTEFMCVRPINGPRRYVHLTMEVA